MQWKKENGAGNLNVGFAWTLGNCLIFFFLFLFLCYCSLSGNSWREKCYSIMASMHFYFLCHNSHFMTLLDPLILSAINFWLYSFNTRHIFRTMNKLETLRNYYKFNCKRLFVRDHMSELHICFKLLEHFLFYVLFICNHRDALPSIILYFPCWFAVSYKSQGFYIFLTKIRVSHHRVSLFFMTLISMVSDNSHFFLNI